MSFYHAVFKITYRLAPPIREWIAQDEVRATGQHAAAQTYVEHILAPSEAIAVAHFDEQHSHEVSRPEYQFSKVSVERITLDACLIRTVLS